MKIVALIGLICVLAPGARGGFLSSLMGPAPEVDFNEFEYWLTKGLPNNENPQANLKYVSENQSQLTKPAVSRSAQIFGAFLGAPECNGDMLMYARDMRRNKVSTLR